MYMFKHIAAPKPGCAPRVCRRGRFTGRHASRRWLLVGFGVLAGAGAGCRAPQRARVTSGVVAAAESLQPVDAGSRRLVAGRLVVEVMDPNDAQRYNRGVRFTPIAAVLAASLKKREFLYHPVQHDPVDDHAGLAAEFDLVAPGDPDAWLPPGYLEARVGEGYLKVGVGVLCKQADRYSLFQHPKLLATATTTVVWHPDTADFHQVCSGTNGYAYDLRAVVRVGGNQVDVEWALTNTGVRAFTTRSYSHNFFRLGDRDTGPGCELSFPYDFRATGLEPQQEQAGRVIRFMAAVPRWANIVVPWPAAYAGPNQCTLRRRDAGMAITCETSMPGMRTAVHVRPGYISPEQFIELNLAPGGGATWTRMYRLEVDAARP